jgi:tetratricopeptide (TPR) repeat protein
VAAEAPPLANRRVVSIVALAALVAAGAIVAGTVLQSRNEHTSLPGAITTPRSGPPLLELELGRRRDAEARALAAAERLLDVKGDPAAAAAIFRRYHSFQAQLGAAFASWSGPASLAAVQQLAAAHPDDPGALLNLGLADYQAGRNADAVAAWREVATHFPDSPYAVDAEDALHPGVAPGLPPIIADVRAVPHQARADLAAGIRLWDLKHVVSARRHLDAAAKRAPHAAETLVASAVARFSPASPLAPFPQLGPLTAEFPRDPIVRLHLGLLLLWTRQVEKGKAELRAAAAEAPASASVYVRQARELLKALAGRSG